jgi:hypothetical protein
MQAREIIERLGGQSAVAQHLEKGQSTVAYWVKTGVIPARWKPKLYLLSVKLGVRLTAEDLIGTPEDPMAGHIDSAISGDRTKAGSLTVETKSEILAAPADPAEAETLVFREGSNEVRLRFDGGVQAIWATTKEIAELFDVDPSTILKHIQNIFEEDELSESATTAKFTVVRLEGSRQVSREVTHYNLDVILSVGYRVNAKRATSFRKWATQTLRAYLDQGYVINEKALRESPEKLNRLAAQIRSLRSEEKQVYAKVRECFKLSSSDYDSESRTVKSFYALLQDKFHHAVTGSTASKLIMDRADHTAENMGLQSLKGEKPTLADATAGKNYLKPEELYRLHILSEQFLLYAEGTALAGKNMTMESLHRQLDRLLTLNDYPVFESYKDYIKDQAIQHARIEFGQYKKRLKIEAMGLQYDEEALASGEYDGFLLEN